MMTLAARTVSSMDHMVPISVPLHITITLTLKLLFQLLAAQQDYPFVQIAFPYQLAHVQLVTGPCVHLHLHLRH